MAAMQTRKGQPPDPPSQGPSMPFGVGLALLLVCLGLLGGGIFVPIYLKSLERTRESACLGSQKDLARGLTLYAMDFDGLLPKAEVWGDAIAKNVYPESFRCVNDESFFQGSSSYAFAGSLSGILLDSVKDPHKTPMVFDAADGSWNLYGDLSLMPKPGRHQQGETGNMMAFADGSVRFVPDGKSP